MPILKTFRLREQRFPLPRSCKRSVMQIGRFREKFPKFRNTEKKITPSDWGAHKHMAIYVDGGVGMGFQLGGRIGYIF